MKPVPEGRPSSHSLLAVLGHVEIERKSELEQGGTLLTMMLVISIVMGIVPLFGIAWTIVTGTIMTQDGLFISLILLMLSGVFFLNAYWELRDHGALAFLQKKKEAAAPAPAPAKTASAATAPSAPKPTPKAASENKEAALKGSES